MNWYIIHISCCLLIHVKWYSSWKGSTKLSCPALHLLPFLSIPCRILHSCLKFLTSLFCLIKNCIIPHSHHTIHLNELAMPIYVIITTVPILLILILGDHFSWKLSPVNLLTQASIGGNFSPWCCLTFAAWLLCMSQLGYQKWRLSGPFQLHLYTSLQEIHSNGESHNADTLMASYDEWLAVLFWYVTAIGQHTSAWHRDRNHGELSPWYGPEVAAYKWCRTYYRGLNVGTDWKFWCQQLSGKNVLLNVPKFRRGIPQCGFYGK